MPQTVAHIGAQALGTRALVRPSDGVWILAACAVPDLPWVLQRIVEMPGVVDPYALRFYAIAQASLLCSLLLCAALASLARQPGRAFGVLALGCLLHLLLDASQEKLGNGVHLFAPFSWKLLHFDLYTPESAITLAWTLLGAAAIAWLWREPPTRPFLWSRRRAGLAGAWTLAWLLLPLSLLAGPEHSDAHSTRTLRDVAERPGREVDFDRNRYVRRGGGHSLHTWAGETIRLTGPLAESLGDGGVVSLHGRFLDAHTVEVLAVREHPPGVRDGASVVGLLVIGAYWTRALRRDPPWGKAQMREASRPTSSTSPDRGAESPR